MKIVITILALLFFISCKQVERSTDYSKKEATNNISIIRDTVIVTQADTAMIKALFRCDSSNRVIMSELTMNQGVKVKPMVVWSEKLQTIYIEAVIDSQSIAIKWAERHTKEEKQETMTETVTKIVKVKPWWLKILGTIGAGALSSGLAYILWRVYKFNNVFSI